MDAGAADSLGDQYRLDEGQSDAPVDGREPPPPSTAMGQATIKDIDARAGLGIDRERS